MEEEFDEQLPDLTSAPSDELKELLGDLVEEERRISYRRRIIQGRIDAIRAELVRRGAAALTPEELAEVMLRERGFREEDAF
ncbi:MAG: hypothetical protein K6T51_06040 [Rubrobacteraceae bacterium]|uniref:RsiG family protein n=1 Tax=Rubrobacter naiadicus TaxID=1392641 RepID=UPI00235F53FD|nr:hypothetical protein [Rubrobacter naiadicus]MBX6764798.1 hypothetical protein [Rubrobacteraceae bacterium]MCL6438149.1 hypothetical protein [Rubrobacteraceae bacterium]